MRDGNGLALGVSELLPIKTKKGVSNLILHAWNVLRIEAKAKASSRPQQAPDQLSPSVQNRYDCLVVRAKQDMLP
jgi:hypothetical protein